MPIGWWEQWGRIVDFRAVFRVWPSTVKSLTFDPGLKETHWAEQTSVSWYVCSTYSINSCTESFVYDSVVIAVTSYLIMCVCVIQVSVAAVCVMMSSVWMEECVWPVELMLSSVCVHWDIRASSVRRVSQTHTHTRMFLLLSLLSNALPQTSL